MLPLFIWTCTVYSTRCLLTALYCPATVHAASVYLALYCLPYTLPTNGLVLSCYSTCCLCLFGLVLSTVHAACLTHHILRSSDSYPRLQTVPQQSLACLGTKTSIIASVIAFSHNLSLGAKLAQDGSPCHAPISKYYLLRSYLSLSFILHVINYL